MFWKIIGIAAAACTSFAFVPQIAKMVKTKSVSDISLTTILQFALGVTLWLFYGIYLKDAIIIGANSFCLATLIAALFIYNKYYKQPK